MNFLASTSPLALMASVTSGVQITGAELWPLFTLVGIPLAFLIAGFVVSFIIFSMLTKKKEKSSGYEESFTPEQMTAVTEKIKEIERRPGAGYP